MTRAIRQFFVVSAWSALVLSSASAQTLTGVLPSKKARRVPSFEPSQRVERGQTTLHDQLCVLDPNNPTLGVSSEQNANAPLRTEGASDFDVPAGEKWVIENVLVGGLTEFCSFTPTSFDVRIYSDASGRPSRLLYGVREPSTSDCQVEDIFDLPLSAPCTLESGQYWISIQAIFAPDVPSGAQWFWLTRQTAVGLRGLWRDELDFFQRGCTDWTEIGSCNIDPAAVDFCFAMLGKVQPTLERLDVVAAVGEPVPGVSGAIFTDLEFPTTSENGRIGFAGTLDVGAGDEVFVSSDGAVVLRGSDVFPDTLTNVEENIGLGNAGQFLVGVETSGVATVRNQDGVVVVDGDPAPGVPGRFLRPFAVRPRMRPNGVGYTPIFHASSPVGFPSGVVFYEVSASGTNLTPLMAAGDPVDGGSVVDCGPTFDVSDDGQNRIHLIGFDTGSEVLLAIWLNDSIVMREGDSAGASGQIATFRDCSVNNAGDYAVSGFTDTTVDYVAINGTIDVREGDTIGGVFLPPGVEVRGLNINDRGQVAHLWRELSGSLEALFVGDADRLEETSRLVLQAGDSVDTDGDGLEDATVEGFVLADNSNWMFSFSDDSFIPSLVELRDQSSGVVFEAIVRISVPAACSAGTVNLAAGEIRDVLFVNGSSGGRDRRVEVSTADPFAFVLSQGETESSLNRHVLWVWGGEGRNPSAIVRNGSPLGCLVNPTPFLAGTPQPGFCSPGFLIPQGIACGSAQIVFLASPTAPSFRNLNLMGQPTTFTIQGLLEEGASSHPTGFSVTNAITVVGQ